MSAMTCQFLLMMTLQGLSIFMPSLTEAFVATGDLDNLTPLGPSGVSGASAQRNQKLKTIVQLLEMVSDLNQVEDNLLDTAEFLGLYEEEFDSPSKVTRSDLSRDIADCAFKQDSPLCTRIISALLRPRGGQVFEESKRWDQNRARVSRGLNAIFKRGRALSVDSSLHAMPSRYSSADERKAASLSKLEALG